MTDDNASALARGVELNASYRVIYVFGRSWLSDPDHALEHEIRSRYSPCGRIEVRRIRIYCLLPRG